MRDNFVWKEKDYGKKQFQAESKRLLEMMINSIYTKKEVFLRELISNASDAIDKIYYKALTDDSLSFDKDNYYIRIVPNKDDRTLSVIDTGIGMTKEELEENLERLPKAVPLLSKKKMKLKTVLILSVNSELGFMLRLWSLMLWLS